MALTMFRLYIKGSIPECLEAVKYHGLTAIGCVYIDRYLECAIDVESCHDFLTAWFNEPGECVQFIGFPPGTLLTILKHENYMEPLAKLV